MPTDASRGQFEFPLPPRLLTIEGVRPLALEVADTGDLGPHMRRVRLAGLPDDFTYRPGQDLMLVLGGDAARPLSRRYTIRRHDPVDRTVELNLVAHGVSGPGARWATNTRSGDRVNGVGPRGKIFVDLTSDWHLFLGDESAAAASLAMLESLPDDVMARACLEVASAGDQLTTDKAEQIRWLHRGETPAWSSSLLVEAMQSVELPRGRGHVYIAGEVQVVAAVQQAALARGLAADQVSPKAYWGRGKANANNGEPEKVAT